MKWDHTHHDDPGVPEQVPERTPSVTLKHTPTSRRNIELRAIGPGIREATPESRRTEQYYHARPVSGASVDGGKRMQGGAGLICASREDGRRESCGVDPDLGIGVLGLVFAATRTVLVASVGWHSA